MRPLVNGGQAYVAKRIATEKAHFGRNSSSLAITAKFFCCG